MYVMKVWCEFVFGKCHPKILNQIVERKYDGYLLCKPDLPWVKDELREYPDLVTRETLYHHYKDLLINQSRQWVEVIGKDAERLKSTIQWVNQLITK
jgi:nicotinamide riboside kinase